MEIFVGIVFILLGLALLGVFIFLADVFMLKAAKRRKAIVPANIQLNETVENPCDGVTKAELTPLLGLQNEVPVEKARRKLLLYFAEGHQSIVLNALLYCARRKKKGAFEAIVFEYKVPYAMGKTAEIILPPRTDSIALYTLRLDGEKLKKPYKRPRVSTLRMVWISLLFALVSVLSFACGYCACVEFTFAGRNLNFNLFYNIYLNWLPIANFAAVTFLGCFVACFLFLRLQRSVRRGAIHG